MAETMKWRLAKAVYESAMSLPENEGCVPWERADEPHREHAVKHSRAVLLALREPTKEMILAGQTAADDAMDSDTCSNANGDRFEYHDLSSDGPMEIFQAMIDSALAEG